MIDIAFRQTPRGLRLRAVIKEPASMRLLARGALYQALREWAQGTLPESNILHRFGTSGMARYGFRTRSPSYTRRQMRDLRLRGPAAFVSPRHVPAQQITNALASLAAAKGGAPMLLAASRALTSGGTGRPHMRDLITQTGVGHVLRATGTGRGASINLTFPAARPLNKNPRYGEEFRDLTLAGGRDQRAIHRRAKAIFDQLVREVNEGRRALSDLRGLMLMRAA